jgi:hypothetical protein
VTASASLPLRGIIVEGPDGGGKSSLVKRLQAELGGGWDSIHLSHKDGDQFTRYFGVYLEADRVLIDRGHFSETIYSRIRGREQPFAPWEQTRLDRMARDEFLTILCLAPPSILWRNYLARNDAAARREPGFLLTGGTTQTPMTLDDLRRAHAEFTGTVGPYCSAVYHSDRLGSLDHTVGIVLRAIEHTRRPAPASASASRADAADVILLEGDRVQRSRMADALAAALDAWQVARIRPWISAPRSCWRPPMWSHTILDGGPLTHLVENGSTHDRATLDDWMEWYRYIAARGAIVICAAAGDREHDVVSSDLTRWDLQHDRVNADDPVAVADCVDRILSKATPCLSRSTRYSSTSIPSRA